MHDAWTDFAQAFRVWEGEHPIASQFVIVGQAQALASTKSLAVRNRSYTDKTRLCGLWNPWFFAQVVQDVRRALSRAAYLVCVAVNSIHYCSKLTLMRRSRLSSWCSLCVLLTHWAGFFWALGCNWERRRDGFSKHLSCPHWVHYQFKNYVRFSIR